MALPTLPRPNRFLPLRWVAVPCTRAMALDRNRSIAQHAPDEWTTAKGLPRNTVEAAAQTPVGLLWFATSDGLARLETFRSKD